MAQQYQGQLPEADQVQPLDLSLPRRSRAQVEERPQAYPIGSPADTADNFNVMRFMFDDIVNWDISQWVKMFCKNEAFKDERGLNRTKMTCFLIPGCGYELVEAPTRANKKMRPHILDHIEGMTRAGTLKTTYFLSCHVQEGGANSGSGQRRPRSQAASGSSEEPPAQRPRRQVQASAAPRQIIRAGRQRKEPTPEEKKAALAQLAELKKRGKKHRLACNVCGDRRFTQVSSLKTHLERQHAMINFFTCTWPGCKAAPMTRMASLNYHMMVHTGKEPFKCRHCGQGFRHKNHFREHVNKHENIKSHVCQLCPEGFDNRNSLKNHVEDVHGKRLLRDNTIEDKGKDEPSRKQRIRAADKAKKANLKRKQLRKEVVAAGKPITVNLAALALDHAYAIPAASQGTPKPEEMPENKTNIKESEVKEESKIEASDVKPIDKMEIKSVKKEENEGDRRFEAIEALFMLAKGSPVDLAAFATMKMKYEQ